MRDEEQRRRLGAFVRACRERQRPDARAVRRRRTPGLRREELAAKAGISMIWCAWIEQGRDVQVSDRTLARLAKALNLSPQDRAQLFDLGGKADPEAAAVACAATAAPAALRAVVAGSDHPAYALDRSWNACCWNGAAASLFEDWLGEGRQRNLLAYVFLDPSARSVAPNWRDWAWRVVDAFRESAAKRTEDADLRGLVKRLSCESPAFAEMWRAHGPAERDAGVFSVIAADGVVEAFEVVRFRPASHPDYQLVILTPAAAPQLGAEPSAPAAELVAAR
jgi:transcriptional regulator with XRE-family HTH domain